MPVSISGTNGVTFPDSSLQAAAASPYVLKNRLINGDFRISQRGTTINGINVDFTYTADRWLITRGGSINYTQGTTSPPTGFQYYGSYINQTASNPFVTIQKVIESTNTYDLLGQTVTLSAWIKAAANTPASTSVIVTYGYATTANTRYTTLVSGTTFAISSSAWTKCSITFTVPSNALTIVPVIYNSATLAVGDGYLITGVQLELSSTETPFERRLYNQELANCQRYYWEMARGSLSSNATNSWMGEGGFFSTSQYNLPVMFPVTMRTSPSLNVSNTSAYFGLDTPTAQTFATFSIYQPSIYGTLIYATGLTGGTAGYACSAFTRNASAFCAFSAEL